MIDRNIKLLRRIYELSQEKLAEKIGVSRQTVAKWESGSSLPDVLVCAKLAELFDLSIEDLLNLDAELLAFSQEKGKYIFGSIQVQEGGRIDLPYRARKLFSIEVGDELLLVGDVDRGLALLDLNFFLEGYQALEKNKKDIKNK